MISFGISKLDRSLKTLFPSKNPAVTFLPSIPEASLIDTSSLRGFGLAEPWTLLQTSIRRNIGIPLKIISCLQVAYNLIPQSRMSRASTALCYGLDVDYTLKSDLHSLSLFKIFKKHKQSVPFLKVMLPHPNMESLSQG